MELLGHQIVLDIRLGVIYLTYSSKRNKTLGLYIQQSYHQV